MASVSVNAVERLTRPTDRKLTHLGRVWRHLGGRRLTVYLLKDDLKELWRYRSEAWARKAWKSWKRRALHSGVEPLRVFVRRIEPCLAGILAHWRWPPGTSLVEGINNKIKLIKRMAYGYRDYAYFFLKIRAAFPGLG